MEKRNVIRIILVLIVAPVFIVLIVSTAIAGDHLHKHDCNEDEILRFNGKKWECSTDYDALYDLDCSSDQVAKWDGSEWVCAEDNDTDTDTLGSLACGDGQVAKWNNTDQIWECADEIEQLRIISGNVDASGNILKGLGFSVDRPTGNPTGIYQITFDTPFSDTPTPVVTSARLYRVPSVVTVGSGGFVVIFYRSSGATPKVDSGFYFTVIGPQ